MGDVQFSDQDLRFLEAAESTLTLRCCCQHDQHDGYCDGEAAVTIRFHVPHVCRHPALVRSQRVSTDGCATQILCLRCYWEVRSFCEAKIAQTRAVCAQLSGLCQHCGFVLRSVMFGVEHLLDVCPRCTTTRIEFTPVCGAGVQDKLGRRYGCGAPLQHHTDLIRSEEWMRPQGRDRP